MDRTLKSTHGCHPVLDRHLILSITEKEPQEYEVPWPHLCIARIASHLLYSRLLFPLLEHAQTSNFTLVMSQLSLMLGPSLLK